MRSVFALSFVACVLAARAVHAQPTPPTPPAPDADAGAPVEAPADPDAGTAPPTEAPPPPPPTPVEPPAPTPPVTTAPVSGPYFQPTVELGGEMPPGEQKPAPPLETTLAIELDGGLQRRMGDSADYGFASRESGGVAFGPAIWLAPTRLWSVGLAYRRAGLGSDRSAPGDTSLTVQRRLDTLWGGGRAYPWRTDSMGIFVLLQLGMSWQHADADGSRPTNEFVRPAETYACSAGDGPGFALGGGLGFDVDLEKNLSFIAQADATAHRHTSDTIGGCTPGSGSITTIGANIGFAYKIDLDPQGTAARGGGRHEERKAPRAAREEDDD